MAGLSHRRTYVKPTFVLVVVSFLLSTSVCLVSLYVVGQNNAREMSKALATRVYDYIDGKLSLPISVARTMSCTSFLVDELSDVDTDEEAFTSDIVDYLRGIEQGLACEAAFVISDASGGYYTRDGRIRDIEVGEGGADAWYTELVESGAPYALSVGTDERDARELTVYVDARIEDGEGRLVGVCGLGVRLDGMQELFRTFEDGFHVKVDLVDDTGIAQIDTADANIGTLDLSATISSAASDDYVYTERPGAGYTVTKYIADLDWYLVVSDTGGSNVSSFAQVIAINALLCMVVLVVMIVAMRINERQARELTRESLIDHLTGLPNKRAYAAGIDLLDQTGVTGDFVCMMADVNGLKHVNDTSGHEAGDELIKGAADCLRMCCEAYGDVFRTGGDEFSGLLHVSPADLVELKARLQESCGAWSGERVKELSVSVGFATSAEFPGADVTELLNIADMRMYADKDRHYAATGAKRRT